jgi:hypothetical protein
MRGWCLRRHAAGLFAKIFEQIDALEATGRMDTGAIGIDAGKPQIT